MTSVLAPPTIGRGSPALELSPDELRAILEEPLSPIASGARVLAIISDKTRDDADTLIVECAGRDLYLLEAH
jgi:hypothetical protein